MKSDWIKKLVRAAAEDGVAAGLRLGDPELATAKLAYYRGTGELDEIVEKIIEALGKAQSPEEEVKL